MTYPDAKDYEKLYARYLEGGADKLFAEAGSLKGKIILDLCGGSGVLAKAALKAGAKRVVLVDAAYDMVRKLDQNNLEVVCGDVVDYLLMSSHRGLVYDLVFCRQAINYWLGDSLACRASLAALAGMMRDESKFIFNTFYQKPTKKPVVRQYECGRWQYVEVSQLQNGLVYHTQFCEGMVSHSTIFRWISPREFRSVLSPHFTVTEKRLCKTSVYICQKRSK